MPKEAISFVSIAVSRFLLSGAASMRPNASPDGVVPIYLCVPVIIVVKTAPHNSLCPQACDIEVIQYK